MPPHTNAWRRQCRNGTRQHGRRESTERYCWRPKAVVHNHPGDPNSNIVEAVPSPPVVVVAEEELAWRRRFAHHLLDGTLHAFPELFMQSREHSISWIAGFETRLGQWTSPDTTSCFPEASREFKAGAAAADAMVTAEGLGHCVMCRSEGWGLLGFYNQPM